MIPKYSSSGGTCSQHPALGCLPNTGYNHLLATACRFVWQLQYLVSQGLYVLLDFSSTREVEPNVADASILARNWGNLWRILADIPVYKTLLKGRIFPDLVNEPRYARTLSSSSSRRLLS